MSRPRSLQELIHWLEVGAGARWVGRGAVLVGVFLLSLVVAWKQFRGPQTEVTLLQAGLGRQLAEGRGFSSPVVFPQSVAFLESRGVRFDPAAPLPDLHQAPLYPLLVAGALRLVPAAWRAELFARPPVPPDGFGADYLLLGLNLLLLWLAAVLTFVLARRLFDGRAAWIASLALLVSVPVWEQVVAVNGTPLPMVLALLAFLAWHGAETSWRRDDHRRAGWWMLAVGGATGLLFLCDYPALVLFGVALGYAAWRVEGRWRALGAVALGFLLVAGPWMVRNVAVAGHPFALAAQQLALRAGDPTAEPSTQRGLLSATPPELEVRKVGHKALASVQQNLKSRLWSGGAMWLAAFFAAGLLYSFRTPATNRLRWVVAVAALALLAGFALLDSGEGERLPAVWLAPLVMIFGAGFFLVLLGGNPALSAWPRVVPAVLLVAQALPLAHDALEPRRLHFQYPPYFPALFQGMRTELDRRGALPQFAVMADVPAGVAWYSGTRTWAQPVRLRDFYALTLRQPVGELLLSPRTLDRPFFSELAARPVILGALGAVPNRFGEWGEVYAGLLTGTLPREFPLGAPTRLAENLYVLLNPALPQPGTRPPAGGK